jgi:hypothetical protein
VLPNEQCVNAGKQDHQPVGLLSGVFKGEGDRANVPPTLIDRADEVIE